MLHGLLSKFADKSLLCSSSHEGQTQMRASTLLIGATVVAFSIMILSGLHLVSSVQGKGIEANLESSPRQGEVGSISPSHPADGANSLQLRRSLTLAITPYLDCPPFVGLCR